MKQFSKNDLMHRYEWHDYEESAPEVSGQPDDTPFNSEDGHQVLYIINNFSVQHDIRWMTSGMLLEKMLKDDLPEQVRSQIQVLAWINANWK